MKILINLLPEVYQAKIRQKRINSILFIGAGLLTVLMIATNIFMYTIIGARNFEKNNVQKSLDSNKKIITEKSQIIREANVINSNLESAIELDINNIKASKFIDNIFGIIPSNIRPTSIKYTQDGLLKMSGTTSTVYDINTLFLDIASKHTFEYEGENEKLFIDTETKSVSQSSNGVDFLFIGVVNPKVFLPESVIPVIEGTEEVEGGLDG